LLRTSSSLQGTSPQVSSS